MHTGYFHEYIIQKPKKKECYENQRIHRNNNHFALNTIIAAAKHESKLIFLPWLSVTASILLSPPTLLEQSKNGTVGTYHIWSGNVHEHILEVHKKKPCSRWGRFDGLSILFAIGERKLGFQKH